MTRNWWMKLALLVVVAVGSAIYVAPTALNVNPETTKLFYKKKVNLGLDLQGGVYMVLGVDFKKIYSDVVSRLAENVQDDLKEKNIACSLPQNLETKASDDPTFKVTCTSADAKKAFYALVKESHDTLRFTYDEGLIYELGISKLYRDNVREKTISQSIEVIRNRIDEFGVAEPVIASQGTDRLTVELPGIKDVERAKELIGRTAKLEFKIVNDGMSPDEVAAMVSELEAKNGASYKEGAKFSDYVKQINELAKGKLPTNSEIAFEREEGLTAGMGGRVPYVLHSKVEVTGDDLKDAFIQVDSQTNSPEVALRFNAKGAQSFEQVTGENIGKRLAIVLDGIVHSAPVIQGRIGGGEARVTLGQGDYNQKLNEAKDLSIVLRAGALPAQLEFLEQRVVGPSLGADSIKKGAYAGVMGCLAIFIFMLLYYRMSGLIADFSLVLNVLIVMAVLIALDATLTLPGIAGIALTVGIAVDSNVVIYERIREELALGKDPRVAVNMGFDKAFTTILDANVTNAFAAAVLMNYGTGPVKGFAVTLLIGILATLFTAVFACKMIFEWYLNRFEVKELSI
ncbi:MAG TPA: protein translocase subunit SecD [Oligoflexia bacterium]|nr:protein translocase subunit SecD [Oligoflexia bacterium]